MKKNTSYKVQVSAGTLILAMRDYFQARRDGRTEEMEAQLRLAEACVNDMEEEAGHIAEAIADADEYMEEEDFCRKTCMSMYPNGIIKNFFVKNFP